MTFILQRLPLLPTISIKTFSVSLASPCWSPSHLTRHPALPSSPRPKNRNSMSHDHSDHNSGNTGDNNDDEDNGWQRRQ